MVGAGRSGVWKALGMVLDFDGEVADEAAVAAEAEEEEEVPQEDSSLPTCTCTRFVIAYSRLLQPDAAVGVQFMARARVPA